MVDIIQTPANNSRFKDLGDGHIAEMIALNIQISYNPTLSEAMILFMGSPHLKIGGTYHRVGVNEEVIGQDLTPLMTQRLIPDGVFDPVTGAALSDISMAGLAVVVKGVYNFIHNMKNGTPGYPKIEDFLPKPPTPEPSPTPEPPPAPEFDGTPDAEPTP